MVTFMDVMLIFAGGLSIFYGYKSMTDQKFTEHYVKTSPKAWLWKKLFGEEKAVKILRKFFAPLAILLGILFVGLGILSLVTVAS